MKVYGNYIFGVFMKVLLLIIDFVSYNIKYGYMLMGIHDMIWGYVEFLGL